MLKIEVKEELENYPEIIAKLGSYKNKFIKWCAIQRVSYEADIIDEFNEFEEKYMKNRLYDKDVKLWKRISKQVFERDKYICQYCGQVGGILEVDHKISISRGGTNQIDNLATSCRKCNRQKKDRQ
jgi:hypothetical protein